MMLSIFFTILSNFIFVFHLLNHDTITFFPRRHVSRTILDLFLLLVIFFRDVKLGLLRLIIFSFPLLEGRPSVASVKLFRVEFFHRRLIHIHLIYFILDCICRGSWRPKIDLVLRFLSQLLIFNLIVLAVLFLSLPLFFFVYACEGNLFNDID